MVAKKYDKQGKPAHPSLGCVFVFAIAAICIILLILNGVVVRSFLTANSRLFTELKAEQAVQYIVPLLMLCFEFWLYDLLIGRN